jgi:hypothetical protein
MKQKKGIFIISLDTELAWGGFDLGLTEKNRKYYEDSRDCIYRLLMLFEKYNIQATFAIVGHIMLNGCTEVEGIKHPDIVRPEHSWYLKDWFIEDPASHMSKNSIWYGQDILKEILAASPQHEIASHSFSHIIFGAKGCTYECARSDIHKCVEIAGQQDIKLKSFIYPRNSEGYKEILKEEGFEVYRGSGNEWYNKFNFSILKKVGHIIDEVFAIAPKTSLPVKDESGLYNVKGNMLYLSRDGIRKLIPISSRVKKAKKGIDKAVKGGEVFHLWLHPFNIATDKENLLQGMDEILNYVREKIDLDQMTSMVISDIPISMDEQ